MGSRVRVLCGRGAAAAFLLVLLLAPGAVSAQRIEQHPHQHAYTFDLIAGITTDPFYITLERGARREARALGVKLVAMGAPDAFGPAAQIPYVNLAIAQHPDAILIAPTDRTALVAPLRRAVRAGIRVITVDTSVAAPVALTHVGSRNLQGGVLAARALAQAIGERGSVAGISVRPGISSTDLREQGFGQELRRYPSIRYLGTSYDNDIVGRAAQLAARQLARHPALAGIFAMNALSGIGVISAITASHREGQVKLIEFDAEPIQVYTLRRGIVDALIAQDPRTMGRLAVSLAYDALAHPHRALKKDYFTQEVILTRANVDSPGMRRFVYASQ